MNRNTNAHFSELPAVDIERSTFDRSCSHKFSGNVGDVIPIFYDEILPGDTVVMDTSKVVRFQTLLTPMMDNIYADVYWFFVPNRLVWDHWINFMGENTQSAWVPQTEYTVPTIKVPPIGSGNNNQVGTILDYLGFPVAMQQQSSDVTINALPIRGYCKIMNDWFRDENLTDPINLYTGDAQVTATTESSYVDDLPHGGKPFRAAKFSDYFTSALPQPQKGDPVTISGRIQSAWAPVIPRDQFSAEAGRAPVVWSFGAISSSSNTMGHVYAPIGVGSSDTVTRAGNLFPWTQSGITDSYQAAVQSGLAMRPVNLWANLGASAAVAQFTVNDLRYAFQLQKLLERDARGGSRYIEVIKAHFNVDSPDQRLQRSEYLGGSRFPIQVNQVSNTAQSEQDFLGDLGAFSVTSDVHSDFTKSFTEHGMLFGLMVLRYDKSYSQMLEKFWKRRRRFDYYWPVMSSISEQPIRKSELFGVVGDGTDTVFAYQEPWADYRYKPSRVSAELRPYVPNGLASWTLSDVYDEAPSFSDAWIREDPANVDRVLAVTSSVANQFWADVWFNFKHTRPMPVYSIPGLIDHH